ncbi:MAG: hypothetical protein DRG59_12645 [Deltaproteobacteria bacterium]|nr:MAG: hypothetical protein DRG59_12645 [Deltaproteobacteria bacterium]
MKEKTIQSFLDELSTDVPTLPGGGCALALSGALAASVEKFVLSINLKKLGEESENLVTTGAKILHRLQELRLDCEELIEMDVRAYSEVINAFKMPVKTETQKKARKSAVEEAFKSATEVPCKLMEYSLEMLTYAGNIVENCYRALLADAGVALEVAHACFWGAFWISIANLNEINDSEFVTEVSEKLDHFKKKEKRIYGKVREKLEELLKV